MNRPVAIGLIAAIATAACDEGNPPVRMGLNTLQMGNDRGSPFSGSQDQVLLEYDFAQPFDAWSWRGTELTNDANTAVSGLTTTSTPFDLTQDKLVTTSSFGNDAFVQYSSSHAFWMRNVDRGFQEYTQHETMLFAREPEEIFTTISSLQPISACTIPPCNVDQQLRAVLTPNTSPFAATLFYPPSPTWNTSIEAGGPDPLHAFYFTRSFWPTTTTPSGPGARPSGTGSVKNLMVVNHGLCSQFQPYLDTPTKSGVLSTAGATVVEQLMDAIEQQITEGSTSTDGQPNATIQVESSDLVSFLHTADARDPSPQGGFMLAFTGRLANLGSLLLSTINVDVEYANPYLFKLLDGRLTVDPLRQLSAGSGEGPVFFGTDLGPLTGAVIQSTLDPVLLESLTEPLPTNASPTSIAATIFQQSDRAQSFADPPLPCTQGAFGDRIPVSPDPTLPTLECGTTFSNIHDKLLAALSAGHYGDYIGVPPTAFDQMWKDTVLATDATGSFYKNMRCAPGATAPHANQCQMVLPANRINVFPDGVELVFVDDDKEYTNPSYVAWLIVADSSDKTLLPKLCDAPQAGAQLGADPTNFALGSRQFAMATADNKLFAATACTQLSSNPNRYACTIGEK